MRDVRQSGRGGQAAGGRRQLGVKDVVCLKSLRVRRNHFFCLPAVVKGKVTLVGWM